MLDVPFRFSCRSHMKKVPIHKIYEASDLSQLLPPIITARQGLTCSGGGSTIICNLLLYRFFFAHKPQQMGRLPGWRLSSLVQRNIFIWTDYLDFCQGTYINDVQFFGGRGGQAKLDKESPFISLLLCSQAAMDGAAACLPGDSVHQSNAIFLFGRIP